MIKHFRVTNFKSLTQVAVDLEPVTVLIGRGGTGKTNFVDALRLLREYLTKRHDMFVRERWGGWPALFSATSGARNVSLFVRFEAGSRTFEYDLVLQQPPHGGDNVGV